MPKNFDNCSVLLTHFDFIKQFIVITIILLFNMPEQLTIKHEQ